MLLLTEKSSHSWIWIYVISEMFCPQISALLFSFGLEDGDSRDIPNSSIPTSLASNMPETPSTIEFKLFITKKKKKKIWDILPRNFFSHWICWKFGSLFWENTTLQASYNTWILLFSIVASMLCFCDRNSYTLIIWIT